jgi:hypothetical protein
MAAPISATWVMLAYHPKFLIPAMSLVGALLAGAVIIALVRRRLRLGETRPDAGNELARYRALYEQGEISEKEYHSLRALLAEELRQSVGGTKPLSPPADPTNTTRATPDTSPGRDLPNTPSDGIRPAE